MTCHNALCTTPPHWRLTDAERPGAVLFACRAHLLPLLTSSPAHALAALTEAQAA